jgi:hypothetical protein
VVEQLPSKHKALNSNPSTVKKERRKRRKFRTVSFQPEVEGTLEACYCFIQLFITVMKYLKQVTL